MANTYTLISSNVLTSSAASVTFSAIPSTYTDLVLRWSARGDRTAFDYEDVIMRVNSDTNSNYSRTVVRGDGSAAISGYSTNNGFIAISQAIPGPTATANTFSNGEIYFANYTASQNKAISFFNVEENNLTEAYMSAQAGLYRDTAAINTITFTKTNNFVSGSSFYLYGIKNS